MANTNDWGKIYCTTHWGEHSYTTEYSIPEESAPSCWATIRNFVVDTIQTFIDSIQITIDKITK